MIVFSRGKAAKELLDDKLTEHGIAQAALSATGARTKVAATLRKVTLGRKISRSDLTPAAILAVATALLAFVAISQSEFYLTPRNFGLILPLLATLAFFAMAQQIVMMIGGIDLSVGPLAGLLVVVGSFVLSAYKTPVGMLIG